MTCAFGLAVGELAPYSREAARSSKTHADIVLSLEERSLRRDGYTARSTASTSQETGTTRAALPSRVLYLVVLDRGEADVVCDYIRHGGDRDAFLARFAHAASPGFDPDRDLVRVGLANQTTMLMSESLEIGVVVEQAFRDRYGDADLAAHYRAFDTICSATQERQDAVVDLLDHQSVDLMVVIGGYNSSNTCNLARLCGGRVPTFHIADAECLVSGQTIRHRPIDAPKGSAVEIASVAWLPDGPLTVGLTAGASTPDAIVGRVVQRLADLTTVPG